MVIQKKLCEQFCHVLTIWSILKEIAKHFDRDEEGYDAVLEAIDTMTGVAWYINDMKRKHEHAVRVQVRCKCHIWTGTFMRFH